MIQRAIMLLFLGISSAVYASSSGGDITDIALIQEPLNFKEMSVDKAISDAEKWFNAQTTLKADFAQTMNGRTQTGVFYLKRPRQFLWQYELPTKQKVISTGAYTYFHDEETGQTTQVPNSTPLIKLLNKQKIVLSSDDFSPVLARETEKSYQLKIAIMDDGIENGYFTLEFKKKPNELSKIIMEDVLGNQTIITLSNIVLRPKLSEKLFAFTPPQYKEN